MSAKIRVVKDIEHVMEALFTISEEDASALLPTGFRPCTLLGKGLLQLAALKYRDLAFEGRSLGPCTDVYAGVAVQWNGQLNGFLPSIYNNSEEVVEVVNKNWFFGKKFAKIDWTTGSDRYSVRVTYDGKNTLEYSTSIPSRLLVIPYCRERGTR